MRTEPETRFQRRKVRVLPGALKLCRRNAVRPDGCRGFTQPELAAAVGCGESTIGMIEAGRRQPSVDLAAAIADVLGCRVDDFAFIEWRAA